MINQVITQDSSSPHGSKKLLSELDRPLLSIVIPAHNEESRLPPSLEKIDAFLQEQAFEAEVIVVENGSTDRTIEVTQTFIENHPYTRLIQAAVRGKGLAVKVGMQVATGQYRFICDADLSMPIEEIKKFLPPHVNGYDVIIATREGRQAQRIGEPEYRHLMGRVFNFIVRTLAIPKIQDTQCGFKVFRRVAAREVLPLQTIDGWGFDVEILFIALRHGFKLIEIPITWYYRPQTKINPVQDSVNMFVEVMRVRINGWRGVYGKKQR